MDEKLKKLSEITSFSGRIKFCDNNFSKIKAGSSRIAYDYAPGLIIKLAKNEKGLEQNRTEADYFIQQHYKDIVANVKDSDPNDYWMVVEKVERISPNKFKSLTQINFDDFCMFIKSKFHPKENIKVNIDLNDNEFVGEVMDLIANFNLLTGDITKISSWGDANGRAVLSDYGLTEDTYNRFYRKAKNIKKLLKMAEKFEKLSNEN